MDEIEKVLRKAKKKDRASILTVMEALKQGKIDGLKITKLTNSHYFRVKVGDYRVIFLFDQKTKNVGIVTVRRRDESTYQ